MIQYTQMIEIISLNKYYYINPFANCVFYYVEIVNVIFMHIKRKKTLC